MNLKRSLLIATMALLPALSAYAAEEEQSSAPVWCESNCWQTLNVNSKCAKICGPNPNRNAPDANPTGTPAEYQPGGSDWCLVGGTQVVAGSCDEIGNEHP
jgi:hypothetical protein